MSRRYRKAAEVYAEVLSAIEEYTAENGRPPELSDILRSMDIARSAWNYYFASVKKADPKAKAKLYKALGIPCDEEDTGMSPPRHFPDKYTPPESCSIPYDDEDGDDEEEEEEEDVEESPQAEEEPTTPARALNEVILWLAELPQKDRIRVISSAAAFYDIKGAFALTETWNDKD